MPGRCVMNVGITGHRRLGDDPRVSWHVFAQCVRHLDELLQQAHGRGASLVACTCLAVGADQLFAQAAVGLGVPIVGFIPFADYPDDFSAEERPLYDQLLALCSEVVQLPRKRRSNLGYLEAGKKMVHRLDHLLAVWNGLPAKGVGGTADIVAYAQSRQCPVTIIEPALPRKRLRQLSPG